MRQSCVWWQDSGHAVLFTFHPISGKPDIGHFPSAAVERLNCNVVSIVMLAQADEHYLRPILLLDTQKQVIQFGCVDLAPFQYI